MSLFAISFCVYLTLHHEEHEVLIKTSRTVFFVLFVVKLGCGCSVESPEIH